MPRVARTDLGDGFFHVTARGIAQRGHIFRDDDDRKAFLRLLARCADRYRWSCHALCLMGTHYHLVVEAEQPALSSGLCVLNGRYAARFNRKYALFGHVFADRYAARLIESEEYLYDSCSYVLLNPVRAGLCDRADDWPWSYSRYEPAAV